ncbi:helix-turn-helix transcriptional regulator [Streptococcus mutans]|uniref:winged helix-turn-helix transcriptional regulator n=1 Tax=Streptococcus mutans TaxID=1309 RepID=UPI00040F1A37|nr:helix-turn-helix domain-containing protein [Streptococcus mutans]AYO48499.1 transcriptional regulator [Streptococcus mutans]MCB4941053.1 helix-turn-helix transcriptional regulator [Streptococcus mutans]MCB5002744.1 helix-turn-helix transcriptional regulator [Streptococcus mutans]MCB5013798.1 helix-turn-helix transcriptional regulator [Streptococcus mutans]MCB5068188.1 helix-turn-helix transcriptional regulator [Streptococcus mutans]
MSQVMEVVGGKWRLNVLWVINKYQSIRFNQLKREVNGITTIMLTRSLDILITNELVEKVDFQTLPLHVKYQLLSKGKSLMPLLKQLNQWGKLYL